MEANDAVEAVAHHVRSAGIDYPTTGLRADRFEAGWVVYAPVEIDTSDPAAFLDMPVGRAVFLIGDSGRIQQVSSSEPPQRVQRRFAEQERARVVSTDGDPAFFAEFQDAFQSAGGDPAATFTVVGALDPVDTALREQASTMLDDVARRIAAVAPAQWLEFRAEFAFTVRQEIVAIVFVTPEGPQPRTTAPSEVIEAVRRQREVEAAVRRGQHRPHQAVGHALLRAIAAPAAMLVTRQQHLAARFGRDPDRSVARLHDAGDAALRRPGIGIAQMAVAIEGDAAEIMADPDVAIARRKQGGDLQGSTRVVAIGQHALEPDAVKAVEAGRRSQPQIAVLALRQRTDIARRPVLQRPAAVAQLADRLARVQRLPRLGQQHGRDRRDDRPAFHDLLLGRDMGALGREEPTAVALRADAIQAPR